MDIEFHEFSRGKDEISPVDFARLILRYSMVRREDYAKYIKRVRERSKPGDKVISSLLDVWYFAILVRLVLSVYPLSTLFCSFRWLLFC